MGREKVYDHTCQILWSTSLKVAYIITSTHILLTRTHLNWHSSYKGHGKYNSTLCPGRRGDFECTSSHSATNQTGK